ncbi:Cation/H(+) antiporter 4 [Linum perenne]
MGKSDIVWKNETICIAFPPHISAEGLSYENIYVFDNLFAASLTLLNIQIFLIFAISNSLHCLLRRLRISAFVSQALTGVILGPTLLGKTDFFKNTLFPQSSQDNLELIATIEYATFMLLVGVKMDVATVVKSGKKALTTGLATSFFPLFLGLAAQSHKIRNTKNPLAVSRIFAATEVQCFTSFAVVSQVLDDLRLTNSEIGRLALSSSLVTGTCGAILTLALVSKLGVFRNVLNAFGVFFAIFIASYVIRPTLVSLVTKRTTPGERLNPCWVFVVVAMVGAYQVFFDVIRQAFILGPFIFGLFAVPSGPPLGSLMVEILEPIPQALFFPVFVAMTLMKADLTSVLPWFDDRGYFIALVFWTAILKFVVCLLLTLRYMPVLESIVLSLIMNAKGVVDISSNAYLRDIPVISPQLYSLFSLAIIVNATVIPVVLSFLYEPSRRYASKHSRNIATLKPFTELRILACIHKPHNVVLVTKLLDTLCRTEESVVALFVIHLLEQISHATPVFMSHEKQSKSLLSSSTTVSDTSSPSIDIVFAFNQCERKNIGFTSLQSFTSISQYKLMQEDIFTLALDKLVSLILIPFHRKWSLDGRVESDDNVLRALNMRILDTAPCSVGILYDRARHLQRRDSTVAEEQVDTLSEASSVLSSSRSVCMIYLGGRDDQEAISLAKRMVADQCVHLTIIHMVVKEDAQNADREGDIVLRGFLQETAEHLNVQYLEKFVSDGSETIKLVTSIASQYDLFVVGRRSDIDIDSPQIGGLANWSEFPELGLIGDLLASNDVQTRGSVLVVQQQKKLSN